MKKKSLCEILIILFNFFIALPVYSQNNFAYKAVLADIRETRFYKIDLPPAVVANCKPGLEDIRIIDADGKQVPYILKNDIPEFKIENLTEFPVISNNKKRDKQTHVILENITGKPVSNLLLFIRNTDAQRLFSVSGSDDSTHWFIIKENISLENNFNNNDGENFIQTLSFPPGNYKYFQITMQGENLLPFYIVKAGVYNEHVIYGKYSRIPAPVILQKDSSDKKSYIFLNFDNKYQVNKLDLEVEGVKYFRRELSVLEGKVINNVLLSGYLNSDSINSFLINSKSSQLLLIINNEDNIPLNVKEVKAFQLNICLLTYMEAGKKYFLSFGDSTLRAPKYDLRFFSDSIEKNPLELSVNHVEKNKIVNTAVKLSASENKHVLLWIIMITILLILCLLTFKMMREVNKKTNENQ